MKQTLEMLADTSESINWMYKVKRQLTDRAIKEGATWQDICIHDKIEGIRYCRTVENVHLLEAKKMVDLYLGRVAEDEVSPL
jgi:ribosomal protein L7/L12